VRHCAGATLCVARDAQQTLRLRAHQQPHGLGVPVATACADAPVVRRKARSSAIVIGILLPSLGGDERRVDHEHTEPVAQLLYPTRHRIPCGGGGGICTAGPRRTGGRADGALKS
jgi:hypothetical protein